MEPYFFQSKNYQAKFFVSLLTFLTLRKFSFCHIKQALINILRQDHSFWNLNVLYFIKTFSHQQNYLC